MLMIKNERKIVYRHADDQFIISVSLVEAQKYMKMGGIIKKIKLLHLNESQKCHRNIIELLSGYDCQIRHKNLHKKSVTLQQKSE